MSSIDEVISRSRQPGEFTERRTFSVARGRAIQKLREFALVDPHYYILELIQSAVANKATFIDIQCDRTTTALSYVGGNFREVELAQLFDFLFASKDDVEHGPLRQMALGVNALMLFEPDEIVIETGDGTLKGTTRVVISGKDDTVEVGRPEQGLKGTFLRATGLKRRKVKKRSSLKSIDRNPKEFTAVENRCITAPVPILFNHQPLFGYSSQRTPESLWGFAKTLTFDEGDLYGTVGRAKRHSGAVFRLVTDGVWIQSVRYKYPEDEDYQFGGVITFDRLRKTADHGSIVEDERYREMWLRVRAYVNQLESRDGGDSGYDARTLAGDELSTQDLLDVLREFDTVVLCDTTILANEVHSKRALQISESIDAPAICVARKDSRAVRSLAGPSVTFVIPDLDDDQEFEFFTREEQDLPKGPWLIAPVELESLTLEEVARHLPWPEDAEQDFPEEEEDDAVQDFANVQKAVWLLQGREAGDKIVKHGKLGEWKAEQLDPKGESIRAQIISPEDRDEKDRDINIEVRASKRVVWTGWNEAIAPGQVLVIEVTTIPARRLWEPFNPVPERKVRESMTTPVSMPAIEREPKKLEVERAEYDLSKRPGSGVDKRVPTKEILVSDAQSVIKEVNQLGEVGDASELVSELIAEIVIRRQLNRLESAADLGVRAALRAEVQPNSTAAQLILTSISHRVVKRIRVEDERRRVAFSIVDQNLDPEVLDIEVLSTLSGAGVSLRRIEELLEIGHGLVYGVRKDVTPDLRGLDQSLILDLDQVQEQMLISLVGPSAYVRVDRRDILAEFNGVRCRDVAVGLCEYPEFPLLIEGEEIDLEEWSVSQKEQILDALLGQLLSVIQGEAKSVDGQEDRRQAWRHLQYFVVHRRDFDFAYEIRPELDELFLFRLSGGRTCSFAQLEDIIATQGHIEMLDGWAIGAGELTFRDAAYQQVDSEEDLEPYLLAMNPFVMNILGDSVQGAAEYHLSQQEVEALGESDVEMMLESVIFDDDKAQGVMGIPVVPVKRAAVVVFGTQRRDAILRQDLGEAFGVVGKVRLRQEVTHEEVEAKLTEAARDVLSHLLIRLPSLEASGDRVLFERAVAVLLDYAAGRVQLSFGTNQLVTLEVWDILARQILNTPIFPSEGGLPISAMSLYREFQRQAGAALVAGEEDFEFRSSRLCTQISKTLQQWIYRNFRLEEVLRPACQAYRGEVPEEGGEEARSIAATLDHWINALRPDSDEHSKELRKQVRIKVQVSPTEEFFTGTLSDEFCQYVEGRPGSKHRSVLHINGDHWISRWLLAEGGTSQKPIAWATLAGYAHVNNVLERVTNDHELIFQQRVAQALEDGKLEMVASE